MIYKEVAIQVQDTGLHDILIALLAGSGYEGFEENDSQLKAFINADQFSKDDLEEVLAPYGLDYTIADIRQQNWNATWEQSFEPVVVDDLCTIRADFHPASQHTRYEVIVTPKMSFGTGHHATTQLMVRQMGQLDFAGRSVFDFGTGTGVLAILAQKMGAAEVLAIDNDEWSYENAKENVERNNATNVHISLDDIDTITGRSFDLVLANINRHILLQYMSKLAELTSPGGAVLMSGLLTADRDIIVDAATVAGFRESKYSELNGWICLLFSK